MRHIRLTLEYEGTGYQGWQSQVSGNTIQDTVARAIARITGEGVRLTGASRTDAGVHALHQVAAFSTGSSLSVETLKKALNAVLPADIRVLSVEETNRGFHPRYAAEGKSYLYLIHMGEVPSAFLHRCVWHMRRSLDIEAMACAARLIEGRHDFSAFRAAGCSARTTVRELRSITLCRLSEISFMTVAVRGDFLRIRLEADAFLRHMARNIVGTLVEVGRGKIPQEEVKVILDSRDRKRAGPTAPAKGLFLEQITLRGGQ